MDGVALSFLTSAFLVMSGWLASASATEAFGYPLEFVADAMGTGPTGAPKWRRTTGVELARPPGQSASESVAPFAQDSIVWRGAHLLNEATTTMRHRLQRLVLVRTVADPAARMGRRSNGGGTVAEKIRVIGFVVRPGGLSQKRHRNGKQKDAHGGTPAGQADRGDASWPNPTFLEMTSRPGVRAIQCDVCFWSIAPGA